MSTTGTGSSVVEETLYGYVPSRAVAIIMLTLFGLSFIAHGLQMVRYRMWFLLPTVLLCGNLEIIGWAARLWSSLKPDADLPFKIQISTTVLAPTPLLAANFVIFGRLTRQLGPAYSRLRPRAYTLIFCGCDILSLLIQGGGGGIASGSKDGKGAKLGSNIMLVGIILQTVAIVAFSFCAAEYLVRYHKRQPFRPNVQIRDALTADADESLRGQFRPNLKLMVYALGLSMIVLFIRAVYRVIELADGWEGTIIHTEVYFNVFDAAMIVVAMYLLNFAHPGRMLALPREHIQMKEVRVSV